MLKLFIAVDDFDKSRKPLMSAQGQGMDGFTKLANYDALIPVARALVLKLGDKDVESNKT
jgi:hypothetical protein